MKHRVFAPALGVLVATLAAGGVASQASAADPSGIWAKDDGMAKMEIRKCGRGICSKIVWLRDPKDSRGRPLRDARNENPSMRDRPIMGLPLFSNMVATASNSWVGNVYNPEEGRIYTKVQVTLVSRRQIVLKGCKAWLLCGEKVWTRSKLPPTPAEPEKPIEVKAPAAPEAPIEVKAERAPEKAAPPPTPKPEVPIVEAAREPEAAPAPKALAKRPSVVGTAIHAETVGARVSEMVKMPKSSPPRAFQHAAIGIGFVMATTSPEPLPLSGENVSSMIVMASPSDLADPVEPEAAEAAVEASLEDESPPAPAPKPKPKAKPKAQAEAAAKPVAQAPRAAKRRPKRRQMVQEPDETLPWLQGR